MSVERTPKLAYGVELTRSEIRAVCIKLIPGFGLQEATVDPEEDLVKYLGPWVRAEMMGSCWSDDTYLVLGPRLEWDEANGTISCHPKGLEEVRKIVSDHFPEKKMKWFHDIYVW